MDKEKMKKALLYSSLLVLFALYIWLRVENSRFIREPRTGFGDTNDYFKIASLSIFSSSFWLSVKPPVFPLFLKFLGDNANTISTFQLWFSIFSWGLLAYVVASSLKMDILKPFAFAFLLAFSMSEEIIMWDYLILSDSIALSILALFCAVCLWALSKWNVASASLLIFLAILLAFVRDTYAYVLLMIAGVLFIVFFFSNFRKQFLYVGIAFSLIFLTSSTLASAGFHWYTPLLNTIGMRVLPNSEYLAYFESRGMPVSNLLMERSGKPHHADDAAIAVDERLEDFRDWVRENGEREYKRFLWFYKADTLQNVFNDREEIFSPDLYYYNASRFRPILQNSRLDELLYPNRFGFFLFIVANLSAALFSVVAYYEKKVIWILPLTLILLSYPQAVLIWNADPSDMARHALYHNVMMRLGVWILALYVLDFVVGKAGQKIPLTLVSAKSGRRNNRNNVPGKLNLTN
ncbi:MAG: hypothetical protein PVJ21_19630 [Anaerolineales bacterium]|jgi:hypothetical protein